MSSDNSNEIMEKDAARYRWLKSQAEQILAAIAWRSKRACLVETGDVDAIIDVAMRDTDADEK